MRLPEPSFVKGNITGSDESTAAVAFPGGVLRKVPDHPPFPTDDEFNNTVAAVKESIKPGGQGEELQQLFLKRAEDAKGSAMPILLSTPRLTQPPNPFNLCRSFVIKAVPDKSNPVIPTCNSWLIDWWNEYAYLDYEGTVVLNVNYFLLFPDVPIGGLGPSPRAVAAAPFVFGQKSAKLSTLIYMLCTRAASIVYSARQFQHMFETESLVPDWAAKNVPQCMRQKKETMSPFSHKMNWSDVSNRPFLPSPCQQCPPNLFPRDRVDVVQAHQKRRGIELLKQLRIRSPRNIVHDRAAHDLCADIGPGVAVLADRQITRELVLSHHGKVGFNGEHSMMDATPTSRLCEYISELTLGGIPSEPQFNTLLLEPARLDFFVSPPVVASVECAIVSFTKASKRNDFPVLKFTNFGKDTIKTLKCSPDAFVQMAMQLAFYRTVSLESVAFVRVMEDPESSIKHKDDAARTAIETQSAYMSTCLQGNGIDRHLLGLRLLQYPWESTALFLDPAYSLSSHWTLSTSQVPANLLDGYGWGEVVPDGSSGSRIWFGTRSYGSISWLCGRCLTRKTTRIGASKRQCGGSVMQAAPAPEKPKAAARTATPAAAPAMAAAVLCRFRSRSCHWLRGRKNAFRSYRSLARVPAASTTLELLNGMGGDAQGDTDSDTSSVIDGPVALRRPSVASVTNSKLRERVIGEEGAGEKGVYGRLDLEDGVATTGRASVYSKTKSCWRLLFEQ
ncbi:hypothetical protein BJ742DRAFT_773858 [Cladochytrium replicatum]|nr:hypothetical protein BJ742DRAFT_773858 [Cladochytrium replicatum]